MLLGIIPKPRFLFPIVSPYCLVTALCHCTFCGMILVGLLGIFQLQTVAEISFIPLCPGLLSGTLWLTLHLFWVDFGGGVGHVSTLKSCRNQLHQVLSGCLSGTSGLTDVFGGFGLLYRVFGAGLQGFPGSCPSFAFLLLFSFSFLHFFLSVASRQGACPLLTAPSSQARGKHAHL